MRKLWGAVGLGIFSSLAVGCGDDIRASSKLSGAGGASGVAGDGAVGAGPGTGGGAGADASPGIAGDAAAGAGAGAGGTAGAATTGASGASGAGGPTTPIAHGCSDLFDPARLVDYAVDINADEWAKIDYEFRNVEALKAAGQDYKAYHPVVFHYGGETVADAMIRLKGDSSWRNTVRYDGDKAKMQFVISFEEVDTAAKFHGVSKVVLDMPDIDDTFMQERLAFTTLADMLSLPAPCANSARLTINGQYYGLYVNEENVGHGYIKRVFPEAPDGDLFEGGYTPKTNDLAPNWQRLDAFWDAHDIVAMAAVVDIDASVTEWAAEALLNDGDGYYGGGHNFYIYDYPGLGYRWLIDDADATFAWLGRSNYSPIYWWAGRGTKQQPGQHYLLVMGDPAARAKYVAALRRLLGLWDVARVQGWIDGFAAQIADAVAADPHLLPTVAEHDKAVAAMRQVVADRPAYVAKFLACEDGSGDASDGDGDGFAWCNDCDDANAAAHPGAVEICGNGVDDDCNGLVDTDDGCPM
ncbi:MAG TPA: CotH kinase family protein [Polyangia bacterium]